MALSWWDWAIIAAYLLISLAVGVVFTRRASKSVNEFFISGRHLPWWLAGTSMVATSFAADTPLFVTGLVRDGGISLNWLWWSFAIGGMFSVFFLARLWRRAEVITDVELAELRYSGRSAAVLRGFRAAYMALPVNCISMAWVILAMIKIMGVLFDVNPITAVAICIVLTTIYAVLSGFWGVVVTDMLQFVLAMAGAIVLCVMAVSYVGGMDELVGRLGRDSQTLAFFPRLPAGARWFDEAFWSGPVFAVCVFIFVQWWANKNADSGNVVIQRMLASRDEKQSLLATLWFNIANYAVRPWPWILVALASIVVLPNADSEAAYPQMMVRFLGPGLLGLMIASFLGAFMSTIDTQLNLSAAYFVNDIYRRFLVRNAGQRHYVAVSRVASVGAMVIASLIALASDSISDLFVFLLAFTSGFGAVLILRWFWWRINAWSELSAMIASGVISSGLYVFAKWCPEWKPVWLTRHMILLLTVAASSVIWLTVTFLTRPVSRKQLEVFYRRIRPFGWWGDIASAVNMTPPRGAGRMVVDWLAGTILVLSATLGLGKLFLGFYGEALVYGLLTIISGWLIGRSIFHPTEQWL